MSAHEVNVIIRGKSLSKYEDKLEEILNKGFDYEWYHGNEVCVSDDEISIMEETKSCDFDKLVDVIKEGMPEAEELIYHVAPYWKSEVISEDGCDDEFAYWTKNSEYSKEMFEDGRKHRSHYKPTKSYICEVFEDVRDSIGEDDSIEVYDRVKDAFFNSILKHEYPINFMHD